MTQKQITQKIDELRKAQQARLTQLARADLAWVAIEEHIQTLNEMLKSKQPEPETEGA